MVRRRPPEWISQTHERILEYLADLADDEAATPSEIADEFDRNSDYVSRQSVKMGEAGFLRVLGRGVYQITDKGEKLLNGENFRDLPEPTRDFDENEDGDSKA